MTHDDLPLATPPSTSANDALERRLKHEPLAYIFGHREFYGREFKVTPDVLVPRPDTEIMIDLLTGLMDSTDSSGEPLTLIDVGTGSGAIAITAKLEFPYLDVIASDISPAALKVASNNAKRLKADIELIESDLLTGIQRPASIICANLPYVDEAWQTSPETRFEPDLALFAADGGLKLIKQLLLQAAERQTSGSFLLLEADPRQHDDIIQLSRQYNYNWHETREFIVILEKN